MPANGRRESAPVTETKGQSRGRTRYCKKCKFTCTDAREFTLHLSSHSDSQNKLDNPTETPSKGLRSKRNSRSAASDLQSLKAADMESVSGQQSPASRTDDKEGFKESGKSFRAVDEMDTENKVMEDDEDEGDEPDAMSAEIKVHNHQPGSGKLDASAREETGGGDDIEDEGRLVIDDELVKPSGAESGPRPNHIFSCGQCGVTTTDAKKYMLHLQEEHDDFECDQCDYVTHSKHKLARHKELHEASKGRHLDQRDSPLGHRATKREMEGEERFMNTPSVMSSSSIKNETDIGDDEVANTPNSSVLPLTITTDNIDQVLDDDKKKKKKTRQEVDPGKYFEAVDSSGTKYACSQCGNIYKWRKSLNKHWKEKHSMDPLVEVASPPGMLELLKSGKYTQLGARRIYDNIFLSTIKTQKDDDPVQTASSPGSIPPSPSPPNFLNPSQSLVSNSRTPSNVSSLMPKMIGPFVASTAQPVFPVMSLAISHLHNGYDSGDVPALDLSINLKNDSLQNSPYSVSPLDQEQPLDFSNKKKESAASIKHEKMWDDFKDMKPSQGINQYIPKVHRCSKCEYTSTSELDFANHTSSHLNKRVVKCNQCKQQISSMDELNTHFMNHHYKKLTEHKEAIKKIPHGLQQTYHLLKMDLQDIGELSNQDLGASDSKSLKCRKCDFEAKWPAELQKHAVSHSEERPYICMVCGSTYKWKWDLVKHFQKSHPNLPNPYRRNDKRDGSSEEEVDDEPEMKKQKLNYDLVNGSGLNRDDMISVEGIMAATQAGQRVISSQLNILDDEPHLDKNMGYFGHFKFTSSQGNSSQTAQEMIDCQNKTSKSMQDAARKMSNAKKVIPRDEVSPTPSGSKAEELPYKCTMCNYHARWPSEVTQHMKNHSDSKPYLCPRCEYRSKWKWDVVKHLKRCGGGGINDVIDTTKSRKREAALNSHGPPNAVVCKQGEIRKVTSQSTPNYILADESGQHRPTSSQTSGQSSGDDLSRSSTSTLDLSNNNESGNAYSNNTNNNYTAYSNGQPFAGLNMLTTGSNGGSNPISSSPSHSPPVTKVMSSRTGDTIWNCPHCPFTTASQAELKRHSGLHSDDKPFKCDVCQYSTRWACDLKKHRKSYDHYPPANREEKTTEKSRGRFRCSHCALYFQSLQNLLEHRVAEHIGRETDQASPVPQEPAEIDAARIKHPRKPIKQLQCNKCSFVCKNRQTMEKHKEKHDQLDSSGFQCFYCNSQYKEKESLLDHMSTHSAFNPKEWETYFMINEDEDHQQMKDDVKVNSHDIGDRPPHVDNDHSTQDSKQECSLDTTEARIQQILSEVPKQAAKQSQSSLTSSNKFQCEWCPAEFVNLTAVYKHASQAHPIQLKEQDVSLSLAGQKATQSAAQSATSAKKAYTGEPLEILRQQIAEKRNQQLAEKINEMISNNPKMQEVLSKKMEEGSKRYGCDKCNFSSANLVTFQRHYELHGSKSSSQCWFCDYSVDRMNLLYQHMKISHTRKWKALSQDPKYAEQIQKMNLAFANIPVHGNNNDSPPDASSGDLCAIDLSSKNSSEVTHDVVYVPRQQYTWSGIPVNVIPVDNALNFVCPHCAFNDASIAKTCAHVMQSHRAMAKFTCKKCQFSDDNIHVMSDHCKMSHPVSERIVEVLSFKQLNFSELQMVQMAAMKEKMEMSAQDENTKTMSCPFCPYKTLVTEQMKCHISNHSKQARYRCQFCDFSSDATTIISEHVRVHDKNYMFDNKNSLLLIKEEMSKPYCFESKLEPMDTGKDLSETPISNREKLSSPKSKSNGRIRYRCLACPFYTSCKSNILKHKRQHLHNKRYKCNKCSYSSARAVLLRKHLASHDTTLEDDGLHHDIFYDPNSVEDMKPDEVDEQEEDMDYEEEDDDETNSEDLDEMDAKAIADLEAKDILEAEAAHKTSSLVEDDLNCDAADKQFRKQKCTHCPFSSNSSYEFRKHLNFHGTQERYKCDYCSYSLDRLNLLSQHRKLHSDETDFNPNPPAADLLNTKFIFQQNQLEELHESHEEEKNDLMLKQYTCQFCSYKTGKKKSFDIHCNSHGLRRRYICDYCDWSADRLALLCQHRKVHEGEPNFDAGPEDKVFLNQEFDDGANGEFEAKLMEIKNQDRPKKEGDSDVHSSPPFKLTVVKKIYPCKLCPYKTNSGSSFAAHSAMHDFGAEFSCNKCSYAAPNRGLLQQHMHLHSTEASDIACLKENGSAQNVASVFPGQAETPDIDKQLNRTTENFPGTELTCQRCPFTALSIGVLKEHAKCHAAQDSITCPYCDFSTISKQTLFPHIQIHFPGTKPETLELALESQGKLTLVDQSITNNNNNNTEMAVSKQVEEAVKTKRVYVCQYCEREFEAKHLMIQHEKQHLVGSH